MQNRQILKGFVVLEGIDGSGTTTQLSKLGSWFNSIGKKVFTTCEPTEGEIGLFLRRCLSKQILVQPETMPLLFAADRSEHIYGKGGIIENLSSGALVVSDRYFFSSIAYQGATGFFEFAHMANVFFPLPEILLYFDIEPKAAFTRIEKRGNQKELYEVLQFQENVSKQYESVLSLFADSPMKIIRICARESEELVFQAIKKSLIENLDCLKGLAQNV